MFPERIMRITIRMIALSSILCRTVHSFGTQSLQSRRRIWILPQESKCCYHSLRTKSSLLAALSTQDEVFLSLALEHAQKGFGGTFPNPAVGCVLVRQDTNQVIGSGFHPRAGYPHAEVFALFEAVGHVSSGVKAAESIVQAGGLRPLNDNKLSSLIARYSSPSGPNELFSDAFKRLFPDTGATAYVTLEPCCHFGKTPPCAVSLAVSGVSRVVVGFRDPNPRVDGGGVKLLQEAGIVVDMAEEDGEIHKACADIVDCFVKRITPKSYATDYSWVNGAKRTALRRLAGNRKVGDDTTTPLCEVSWKPKTKKVFAGDDEDVESLELDPVWMERVDALLWENELVNLRLNKAVGKKKLARLLGRRIAASLDAHVTQTVGHTVLLYRPAVPPVLDLDQLLLERREQNDSDEDNDEDDR